MFSMFLEYFEKGKFYLLSKYRKRDIQDFQEILEGGVGRTKKKRELDKNRR